MRAQWARVFAALAVGVSAPLWAPCFAAEGPQKADQVPTDHVAEARQLRSRVNLRSWGDGGEVSHFTYLHASEIFPSAVIERAGPLRELREHLQPQIGDVLVSVGKEPRQTLDQFVASGPVDGLLILHHGEIVYERYPRMGADDRHLIFSVTKAFVGTVVAMLEDRGRLDLNQPVETYLPEMKGTNWAGVRVRDVADMASGIDGAEDYPDAYTNPIHAIFQMEASLGLQPLSSGMAPSVVSGDAYGFLRTMGRVRPPGVQREYVSANTLMLAAIVERVTGERLADVIGVNIWSHIGAQGDALLLLNRQGFPVAHAGLVMTLRDMARFGLLFTLRPRSGPAGDLRRLSP